MTPSNVEQYLLVVAFVVPGIVYQTVRARYLGEVPQNRELTAKVLRALSASTMLALLYAILFADTLTRIVSVTLEEAREFAQAHAGRCAEWAFVLLFVVPAVLARLAAAWPLLRFWAVNLWCWLLAKMLKHRLPGLRRHAEQLRTRTANPSGLRFEVTPTAWDWAVDHAASLNGFVRVHDAEGRWWGGAYGSSSYFSDYPADPAVFVEVAWTMSDSGEFSKCIPVAGAPGFRARKPGWSSSSRSTRTRCRRARCSDGCHGRAIAACSLSETREDPP